MKLVVKIQFMNANQMLINLTIISRCEFYWDHSKAPWFHSWKIPINKIKIKSDIVISHIVKLEILIIGIIGKINTISTSKIKKIIQIKKNRREKGIRGEVLGSNPHSKGELISRS